MLTDLFTIVSIVVAVSGATYTSIVALRDWLGVELEEDRKDVDNLKTVLTEENSGKAFKEGCLRRYRDLKCWNRVWNWSYAVPIVLFFVISFWVAIHTLVACWSTGIGSSTSWPIYRWWLLMIVVLDAMCVISTAVSHWNLTRICRDIQQDYRVHEENRAKALIPSEESGNS